MFIAREEQKLPHSVRSAMSIDRSATFMDKHRINIALLKECGITCFFFRL